MTDQRLQYGDQVIPYQVVFGTGAGSRLRIHLYPDGRIRVRAPRDAGLGEIKRAVTRRAAWLSAQLELIRTQNAHVLPRDYVSGEGHFYLGRRHVLKIRRNGAEPPGVKLRRGRFEVVINERGADVKTLLWRWYQARARAVFDERLYRIVNSVSWIRHKPEWRLLTMRRQWGSCSAQGALILNPHLVKAPSACIDYVLLHELCHLKVHNHSAKFYSLLSAEMPRWQDVKLRLDGMAQQLLNS